MTVTQCKICAQNRGQYRHKRLLQIFPAKGPLEFVEMDVFGPLPKTFQENWYVLVVTDHYSKLTIAIPTSESTTSNVANLFLHNSKVLFRIFPYLLTDNIPQFVSKFFQSFSRQLRIKNFPTASYHSKTIAQPNGFNKIIVTRQRNDIA